VAAVPTDLVTTTDLGSLNARRLADAIVSSGAISRAQLSRDTGLSKPTVSIALARLESAGLVREVGRTQGGRGATALLYDLVPNVGASLALDVGRRWVRARVSDLAGQARATVVEPTRGTTAAILGQQLVDLSADTMRQAGVPEGRLVAATLGVPGVVVPEGDRVRLAPKMPGLQSAQVLERLHHALGVAVSVENDVNLAARAELAFGRGRENRDFVYLSIGTGVGLALVLDGELRTGATGSAGEVGYLLVPGVAKATGVNPVRAGKQGPFEAHVAADGLVRDTRARGLKLRTAEEVVAAARGGDPRATAALTQQARLLATGVANVCAIVDPSIVVIGGGLGVGGADLLLPLLHKALRQLTPLRPMVVVSQLGDHAVLDGAVVDAVATAQETVLGAITGHHRGRLAAAQEAP
jgi:predicted NBD/HSP70 family sugar kinase